MKRIRLILFLLSISLLYAATSYGQLVEYNHPELDWYTIDTDHFQVHYHNGTERTAALVAKIAEEIYSPITSLYQYEPDGKIHFIIRDHDDFSNGITYYYDNKIEIWASPMDFILRGSHNWLRNVVTHEFIHMISLGAARKVTRKIPAFYVQYMGYEPEKNPYVLYGFPNRIVSYPFSMTIIPNWLAEGVSQYQMPPLNYDNWDTHRDMILRTAVLEDEMLTFKEMGVFGKNSLGNEKLYNHGLSLVGFIAANYGVDALKQIFQEMRKPWNVTINGALKKVLGINEKELYTRWKNYLEKKYAYRIKTIQENLRAGKIVESKGFANLFPTWSPDAKKFAFVSNRGFDYLSLSGLYVRDLTTGKTKLIKSGINSTLSWSADGTKIYYSKRSKPNKNGSHYNDLYVYDLKKKKQQRLTRNLRVRYPYLSRDGQKVVFITAKDGDHDIVVFDLKTKKKTVLYEFKNGEQVFQPQLSTDGKMVVFSFTEGEGRKLGVVTTDEKTLRILLDDGNDARDPAFSPDGKEVYFSWDRTGIFNIYAINIESKKITQYTNVLGGAFMPNMSNSGQLLYSDFNSEGYRIAEMDKPAPVEESASEYLAFDEDIMLAAKNNHGLSQFTEKISRQSIDYDDTQLPKYNAKPYNLTYGKISFLPRVMFDYGTVKWGTYLYSGDILDKYNIFGGFAINKEMDYDLFGVVNYRKFKPTIFIEVYNQVRHHSEMDDWALTPTDTVYTKFNYRFNLTEVDVGFDFKLNDHMGLKTAFVYSQYGAKTQPEFKYKGFEFPATRYTYFIGKSLRLTWKYRAVTPSATSEINPSKGRIITFRYHQDFNKFINDFKITQYGTWTEVYDDYNYTKLELDWKEYIGLWKNGKHALSLGLQAGWIDRPVHEFFNFFAGGLIGLRGYPFYSIEGRKILLGRINYRFPIFNHLDFRFINLYFDKLYAGFFYDYGNAFDEDKIQFSQFKKNVGIEVRLDMFSFYNFPTRIFFNAAYGLDRFTKSEKFDKIQLEYGKEWRYYFGIMFGYFN